MAEKEGIPVTEEVMQQLSDILAKKSIRAVAEDGEAVREAWDLAFGQAVPDRDAVDYDAYHWHLFRFGKLAAKSGGEAREALNGQHSQRLHLFWERDAGAWEMRSAFDLDDADVDAMAAAAGADLYLFDDEGCWTYVLTHEAALGPYFFRWG